MQIDEGDSILGIGIDVLETERMRAALERHGIRMMAKLFTEKEQNYCLKHKDPIPHFAARFCAKEAIVKALGTGFGEHASWQDIEILNEPSGKPVAHFSSWLKEKLISPKVFLSLSHSHTFVAAVALWVMPAKKG